MYDELELDKLGDRKTALFLIMSDTDSTFNFLISMIYTQLFNLLCDKADDVYGGKLPIHVRCLIDECANIGQIPQLEKLVATIRSREISACLVLQTRSQLKAIYPKQIGGILIAKLIVAEKPSVAMSYAKVLGATSRQDGYLEGNGYLVSWCVGHLVELAPPNVYNAKYVKWSIADLPILPERWQYLVSASTKKQFGILQKLMHRPDVDSVICATDAG